MALCGPLRSTQDSQNRNIASHLYICIRSLFNISNVQTLKYKIKEISNQNMSMAFSVQSWTFLLQN